MIQYKKLADICAKFEGRENISEDPPTFPLPKKALTNPTCNVCSFLRPCKWVIDLLKFVAALHLLDTDNSGHVNLFMTVIGYLYLITVRQSFVHQTIFCGYERNQYFFR